MISLYSNGIAAGDAVNFNDGYVFINSALGTLRLGDAGVAGKAENQLHVPILPLGASKIEELAVNSERERIFYSNTVVGVDFESAVDDDGGWTLGVGVGSLDGNNWANRSFGAVPFGVSERTINAIASVKVEF